jgi:hypothetical protein
MKKTHHTQEDAKSFLSSNINADNERISKEAFLVFVDNHQYSTQTLAELYEQAADSYLGEFRSFTHLAEHQVDEGLWGEIPEKIKSHYINYKQIGNELKWSGDVWASGNHYFNNNY